jgi:hypothetical protein
VAARLVVTLCVLSAVFPSEPASAEERAVPQLVKRGDSKIAPVLSTFPTIFAPNATSATLVCITNVNANSDSQLEPEDRFLATMDDSGVETFSMLSPILLVDSSTLESSDFVALLDSEDRRLVITYVGEAATFQPGDSVCAQVSLLTASLIGPRTIRFDFPPSDSRFSGAKLPAYITFAVQLHAGGGPMGPTGPTGATGAVGAAGVAGATGTTGDAGATGTAGAAGATGSTGDTGATGASGTGGVAGATGPTGAAGADGTNGTNGATGATGTAGADGTNGTNGTNGVDGATGAAGADGTNGTNGADGATGDTGAAGADGTNGTN